MSSLASEMQALLCICQKIARFQRMKVLLEKAPSLSVTVQS